MSSSSLPRPRWDLATTARKTTAIEGEDDPRMMTTGDDRTGRVACLASLAGTGGGGGSGGGGGARGNPGCALRTDLQTGTATGPRAERGGRAGGGGWRTGKGWVGGGLRRGWWWWWWCLRAG